MASAFGHAASIIGFKKLFPDQHFGWTVLLLGIFSAVMPDFDVIMYRFGIGYESIWGHRGFTHSIAFAALWAILITCIFHRRQPKKLIYLFYYFCCTASHGVLDAMTTGGAGVTFFLPFSMERYFLPWRGILVSPLGVANFFSDWGWRVLASEFRYIGIPALISYGIGFLLNTFVYRRAEPLSRNE